MGRPLAHAGAFAVLALCATLLGCGENPENTIAGRWREARWTYAKFDGYDRRRAQSLDTFFFPPYPMQQVVRHEAEYWEFLPGGTLRISKKNGEHVDARWRLKGRGHVLAVEAPDARIAEHYDIKALNADALVLHYDLGMELRGIAELTFRRLAPQAGRGRELTQRMELRSESERR